MRRVALPADDATAYRPAGGGFGGLTALPIKGFTQLAMSSDGEALFGIGSDTSAMLVTRVGEGPMVSHAVPGPAYNPDVAVDGKGHRIAAWLGAGQTINVSTRTADGVWTDSNTGTTASTLALASNASGDGVLAWTGQPQPLHVASVSLATGAIAPAVTLGDRTAFDPTVAVDLDGSALVAFDREDGNAFELDTAHRDGTGAFGAVLPVGCAQTAPIATDADTLYAGRARLGWAVSRSHTADADTGQACVPDPGPAQPFPNVSPFPVLAGVPVRLDASGAARPGATVTSTTWSIAGAPADGAVITHTFPEAGIYGVTVSTRQVGPDSQPGGDVYVDAGTVDVLSRPAIAIRHVRRRSLHAHVTGMTVFAPVSIVIAVRAHGKRVGHATATTGPAGVDVTVPLHRAHGQLTVILRQAGKRLAVAHPRTRTSP